MGARGHGVTLLLYHGARPQFVPVVPAPWRLATLVLLGARLPAGRSQGAPAAVSFASQRVARSGRVTSGKGGVPRAAM